MPLYGPTGDIISTSDWQDLDRKIQRGDGLGWPGDPRLSLRVGVMRRADGKQGHRLEVWRYNEDGTETRLAKWHPREQFRILPDLARMRLDSPGHKDAVAEIEKHNEKIEAEASRQFQETATEMTAHALHVHQRLNDPGAPRLHSFPGKKS